MHTIREYIEWIQRVRNLDPLCEQLTEFRRKQKYGPKDGSKEEPTPLERDLFLPPNPHFNIQPFENGMGTLFSEVDSDFFEGHTSRLGLSRTNQHIQGRVTNILEYRPKGSPGGILYIGQKLKNLPHYEPPSTVKFSFEDRWYGYDFNQASIWICGQVRSCHDIIEPFLELVDTQKIPSAIADRWDYAWASNIPKERWKVYK